MLIPQIIKKLTAFHDLCGEEMHALMQQIMSGAATSAQIAACLVAFEMKGISVQELTSALRVTREMATPLVISCEPLVDIVGTGGDNAQTFNISTATTFIVAAAGGYVAKHGNRSVSSSSGSADVLELAGVNLHLTPEQVKTCIEQVGVGFLFAPLYHQAMKYASLPRKELGIRTFFNLLGPLSNPARASHLLIGVYDKKWLPLVAEVLLVLKCKRALVVHAHDGLDEISLATATSVAEVNENEIQYYEITPTQFGISPVSIETIRVQNSAESLKLIMDVLNNVPGPATDIVVLNAGAAIYAAGLVESIEQGVMKAQDVIATGQAREKLQQLIAFSQMAQS